MATDNVLWGAERIRGELLKLGIRSEEQDRRVPVTWHPLVHPHPVTGRKALYALGHGAYGVKGIPEAQGLALIEASKTHALQERVVYRHRYAVGDVVIWDTMATMHRAKTIGVAGGNVDARLLWRVSVRGRPAVRH